MTPSASGAADTLTAPPTIDEIVLAEDPERWQALGFSTVGKIVQLGAVRLVLAGHSAGRGILGWSLRGAVGSELDGLPTTSSQTPLPLERPHHSNGIVAIDHVVAMSPQLDRSVQALQAAGLDLRRIREQPTPAGAPRQAFFRLDEVILEVVQEPHDVVERSGNTQGPAHFWGLALLTDDLDHTVESLAPHTSEIRPAIQAGRRIATLRRSAGLNIPVALMSHAKGPGGT